MIQLTRRSLLGKAAALASSLTASNFCPLKPLGGSAAPGYHLYDHAWQADFGSELSAYLETCLENINWSRVEERALKICF